MNQTCSPGCENITNWISVINIFSPTVRAFFKRLFIYNKNFINTNNQKYLEYMQKNLRSKIRSNDILDNTEILSKREIPIVNKYSVLIKYKLV